jgi:hypothetical protein
MGDAVSEAVVAAVVADTTVANTTVTNTTVQPATVSAVPVQNTTVQTLETTVKAPLAAASTKAKPTTGAKPKFRLALTGVKLQAAISSGQIIDVVEVQNAS